MRDTGLLDDKLAAFIEDVRKRWGVSGLSVSLLDGRSQGFGNPTSGPVTPDTVFCISSNTKLFTAVAIGILVEQGKLSFKTKIKDLFPDFCLDNKHTQEFVTVEDALSHSTGCAAGNIVTAYRYHGNNRDILNNICANRCHTELKGGFAYDNRWFSVMGLIIEELSGQSYADFVTDKILKPLEMDRSSFDPEFAEKLAATPTVTLDDGITTMHLPFWQIKGQPGNGWEAPAGLFSTSHDMTKWISNLCKLLRQKERSSDDLPKIISKATLQEIIRPKALSTCNFGSLTFQLESKAMILSSRTLCMPQVSRDGTFNVCCHTGTVMGYASLTLWTPSRDFAITLLANQVHRGNTVLCLAAMRAFELHFGIEPRNWETWVQSHDALRMTGPAKIPKSPFVTNDSAAVTFDIQGTYDVPGCDKLHIVDCITQHGIPANILAIRDAFLKQPTFGRPAGDFKLMAIWDHNDQYLSSHMLAIFHIGGNIFWGEWYQTCSGRTDENAIKLPISVAFPSRGLLLYAFTDTTAEKAASTRFLEVKAFSKTESAPIIALGQGTYTMTRIEALVN